MSSNLHITQVHILKELLFKNGTNFSDLNSTGISTDLFTFHIKKLVEEGWIYKEGKKYFLTQQGKVLAGTVDTEAVKFEEWAKPSVTVTAKKVIKGKVHLLMHQRQKEPFFGYFGFINGKIRYGETSEETAIREFKEETGLLGKPKFLAVYHKLRGPSRKEIILDNFFFLYLMKEVRGTLIDTAEGKNSWVTVEEAWQKITFPGFEDALETIISEKYRKYFEKFLKVDSI